MLRVRVCTGWLNIGCRAVELRFQNCLGLPYIDWKHLFKHGFRAWEIRNTAATFMSAKQGRHERHTLSGLVHGISQDKGLQVVLGCLYNRQGSTILGHCCGYLLFVKMLLRCNNFRWPVRYYVLMEENGSRMVLLLLEKKATNFTVKTLELQGSEFV